MFKCAPFSSNDKPLTMSGLIYITVTGNQLYSILSRNKLNAIYTAKPEANLGWEKEKRKKKLQFGPTLQSLPLWIATSKYSDQIDSIEWKKTLSQIKQSGYFNRMVEKYFSTESMLR